MKGLGRISGVQPYATSLRLFRCVQGRYLCSPVASEESPTPSKRRPKKVRQPDLPHVVRRKEYLQQMSLARVAFSEEAQARAEANALKAAAARDTSSEAAAARADSRATKSEAAFAQALVQREEKAARKEERRLIGLEYWKARNARIDARRMERVETLNAVADTWVTEANLAQKVDDLLDEWFVNSDATAHAQRGTPDSERSVQVQKERAAV